MIAQIVAGALFTGSSGRSSTDPGCGAIAAPRRMSRLRRSLGPDPPSRPRQLSRPWSVPCRWLRRSAETLSRSARCAARHASLEPASVARADRISKPWRRPDLFLMSARGRVLLGLTLAPWRGVVRGRPADHLAPSASRRTHGRRPEARCVRRAVRGAAVRVRRSLRAGGRQRHGERTDHVAADEGAVRRGLERAIRRRPQCVSAQQLGVPRRVGELPELHRRDPGGRDRGSDLGDRQLGRPDVEHRADDVPERGDPVSADPDRALSPDDAQRLQPVPRVSCASWALRFRSMDTGRSRASTPARRSTTGRFPGSP